MRRTFISGLAVIGLLIAGALPVLASEHAPAVTVLSDPLEVQASSPYGEYINIQEAVDVEGYPGDVDVQCSNEDGTWRHFGYSTYQLGATIVNCEATPFAWIGDTALFTVTVSVLGDTTPPSITPYSDPHLVGGWIDDMGGNEGFGAWVNLESNIQYITEPLSVPLSCESDPYVDGFWFLEGSYDVLCMATDAWGNTGYGSYTLEVVDPSDYYGFEITVVDARFDRSTGNAIVMVEATADKDGWMQAGADVTQYFANRFAIVGFGDSDWHPYTAGDTWTYTIVVAGENGKFGGGQVEVRLDARICQYVMAGICDWTGNEALTIQTNLRGGYKG